ncbi:MAG: hypothetical protein SV422_01065, partial [Pseudomonadota bacterium]|nr:hypothetical protein [Pseudomonadota bacterium]
MDIDIFDVLLDSIYFLAAVFFVIGFLLTAFSGQARPVKIFLWILTALFTVLIGIGFALTPFVIFLLFQIVALILIWFMCVVAGAVCGGGLYSLQHKRKSANSLAEADLGDFVPLADFCAQEDVDEERALARIRSGYYR